MREQHLSAVRTAIQQFEEAPPTSLVGGHLSAMFLGGIRVLLGGDNEGQLNRDVAYRNLAPYRTPGEPKIDAVAYIPGSHADPLLVADVLLELREYFGKKNMAVNLVPQAGVTCTICNFETDQQERLRLAFVYSSFRSIRVDHFGETFDLRHQHAKQTWFYDPTYIFAKNKEGVVTREPIDISSVAVAETGNEISHARIVYYDGQLIDTRYPLDGCANLNQGLEMLNTMLSGVTLTGPITGAIYFADGERAQRLKKSPDGKIALAVKGELTAEDANKHLNGFKAAVGGTRAPAPGA
jgi:hypothetical protein